MPLSFKRTPPGGFRGSCAANVRTYTDNMPYNRCKPCSELPSLVMREDGTIDRCAYSAGDYTNGVGGAAGVFTDSGCGVGDWFRTVVTHYAAGDVEKPGDTPLPSA